MRRHFAISPWEHPGANFDPAPHAQTRLEIGGAERRFWLKMRDGMIFFREPALVPLYAVPKRFDFEASDQEQLIARWKREVESGNYGSYFISHRKWLGTPATANYCIIVRENGSGWIKEHFDFDWRDIQTPVALSNPVWQAKPTFSHLSEIICKEMGPGFLNRAVEPGHFQTIEPFWSCGNQKTFEDVLQAALRLFVPPDELRKRSSSWSCRSNSAFRAGAVSGPCGGIGSYARAFDRVWEMLKVHAVFVGVSWRRASRHPELQSLYNPRVWEVGTQKWGDSWRGNWVGEQYRATFDLPIHAATSHHEKLECALVLRDFFRDEDEAKVLQKLLDAALAD